MLPISQKLSFSGDLSEYADVCYSFSRCQNVGLFKALLETM